MRLLGKINAVYAMAHYLCSIALHELYKKNVALTIRAMCPYPSSSTCSTPDLSLSSPIKCSIYTGPAEDGMASKVEDSPFVPAARLRNKTRVSRCMTTNVLSSSSRGWSHAIQCTCSSGIVLDRLEIKLVLAEPSLGQRPRPEALS